MDAVLNAEINRAVQIERNTGRFVDLQAPVEAAKVALRAFVYDLIERACNCEERREEIEDNH